jgi:hypothetical protein
MAAKINLIATLGALKINSGEGMLKYNHEFTNQWVRSQEASYIPVP